MYSKLFEKIYYECRLKPLVEEIYSPVFHSGESIDSGSGANFYKPVH
jgi:hypothetical protein